MSNPNAANQEIRQALQQVLTAADQIGNAPEHPRSPTHVRHDETQQGLILQAWEKLALLTGNHDLARESGFEIPQPDMPNTGGLSTGALSAAWTELQRNQPVIPLHQLRDPFQAMGTAMCHIGSATLQYGLIQDLPGPCSMRQRGAVPPGRERRPHRPRNPAPDVHVSGKQPSPRPRDPQALPSGQPVADPGPLPGRPGPGHRPAAGAQRRPAARRDGLGPPGHGSVENGGHPPASPGRPSAATPGTPRRNPRNSPQRNSPRTTSQSILTTTAPETPPRNPQQSPQKRIDAPDCPNP